jgi:hypothetical protein
MRQAVTTIVVGLCLVLAQPVGGGTTPRSGAGPIDKARRLLEAGDHAAALTVLEDALLESPSQDRPAILGLLRDSYEVLARKAEAAGRTRDAAYYRDNLAILDRNREANRSGQPSESRSQPATATPLRPKPSSTRKPASDAPRNARPPVPAIAPPELGPVSDARSIPPLLAVPAPLPEPERLPAPGARGTLGAGSEPHAPDKSIARIPDLGSALEASPESGRVPLDAPVTGLPHVLGPDSPETTTAAINPGAATADAESERTKERTPDPTPGTGGVARATATREPPSRDSDLGRADRLFAEGQYDDAGRLYTALAHQNQLPGNRRPHWAYCRAVDVVRKINAHPGSVPEWDEIQAEVQDIRRLTPNHWVGEYLRNLVAESRVAGRRPAARSKNLVVRGSEPDEVEAPKRRVPRFFGRTRGAANPQPNREASTPPISPEVAQPLNLPTVAPPAADAHLAANEATDPPDDGVGARTRINGVPVHSGNAEDSSKPRAEDPSTPGSAASHSTIEWQVQQTANFRIFHCDPALAQRAAEIAESVRTTQAKRWGSPATHSGWTPRCDLYLYPNSRSYAQETGQPEISPGISTMTNNGVRVLSRRMNLRADNALLLTSTLPHEVTHIVLSDLFVVHQIPRWADEGIAVLAEPLAEQRNREAELREPLEAGRVFPVSQLMAMEYPEQKDWRLFYAQSVSLTRYLVDQGPPERFIQFVRDSQRTGTAAALRDIYQIEGPSDLHNRWLAHARKQVAVDTASSRNSETEPPTTQRR